MTTAAHKTRRDCECGRTFAKYQGLEVHWRSCRVEKARSNVFVTAVEQGRDPHAAVLDWQRAGRP